MTVEAIPTQPLCPTCPHRRADGATEALAETPADAPHIVKFMAAWARRD